MYECVSWGGVGSEEGGWGGGGGGDVAHLAHMTGRLGWTGFTRTLFITQGAELEKNNLH